MEKILNCFTFIFSFLIFVSCQNVFQEKQMLGNSFDKKSQKKNEYDKDKDNNYELWNEDCEKYDREDQSFVLQDIDDINVEDYFPQNSNLYSLSKHKCIFIKIFTGITYTLDIESGFNETTEVIKAKIEDMVRIPPEEQILFYGGIQLEDGRTLSHYNIKYESTLHLSRPHLCIPQEYGASFEEILEKREFDKLFSDYEKGHYLTSIPIKNFHVSCLSYRPKKLYGNEDLVGIVLYAYKGKIDWVLGQRHCKSGYIIIKKTLDLENIKSKVGLVHGRLYKSVFNIEPDRNVIGAGFSYYDRKWKFNSASFNTINDGYHDNKKEMSKVESQLVMKSIQNWILKGIQDTEAKTDCGNHFVIKGTLNAKRLKKKDDCNIL